MPFELSQIVSQTAQIVLCPGEGKTVQHRAMDFTAAPPAYLRAGVQQNLQQTPYAGVLNADARCAHSPRLYRQGDAPQKRKLLMYVQILRLMTGEPVQYLQKSRPRRAQMRQSFFQFEIPQIVGGDFVAQKRGVFLLLLHPRVLLVRAEQVPPVLDLFHDGLQFPFDPVPVAASEKAPDAFAVYPPQTQLATALQTRKNPPEPRYG